MSFCENCGSQRGNPRTRFCSACGRSFGDSGGVNAPERVETKKVWTDEELYAHMNMTPGEEDLGTRMMRTGKAMQGAGFRGMTTGCTCMIAVASLPVVLIILAVVIKALFP